jgi:hypothetical protein
MSSSNVPELFPDWNPQMGFQINLNANNCSLEPTYKEDDVKDINNIKQ